MTNKITLIFLFLTFLTTGCGSIHSFKTSGAPVFFEQELAISLENLNCNTEYCTKSDNNFHSLIKKRILNILKTKNISIIEKTSAKNHYQGYIISAFEKGIQNEMPRNIYFILKDRRGQEIMQIGLAEYFSTPLTKEYISEKKVIDKFDSLFKESILALEKTTHAKM